MEHKPAKEAEENERRAARQGTWAINLFFFSFVNVFCMTFEQIHWRQLNALFFNHPVQELFEPLKRVCCLSLPKGHRREEEKTWKGFLTLH